MSNNYDDLIERAEGLGIDIDKIVFQLDIGDILGEIVYLLQDYNKLTDVQLKELIEQGTKGTNEIQWSFSVLEFLRYSDIYKSLLVKGVL